MANASKLIVNIELTSTTVRQWRYRSIVYHENHDGSFSLYRAISGERDVRSFQTTSHQEMQRLIATFAPTRGKTLVC